MCGGRLVSSDHIASDALVVQTAHYVRRLRTHRIGHAYTDRCYNYAT